jgi:serine/threonine protein kinase
MLPEDQQTGAASPKALAELDATVTPDLSLFNATLISQSPANGAKSENATPVNLSTKDARFEVIDQLGEGGMGAVFRVRDRDIEREVAFKTLRESNASETFRARFIKECRITGQLEHPNIVPVHDVGVDANGNLYLSMRLVKGETLGELITRLENGDPEAHRTYSLPRRLELFLKILAAMELAHARGIVHRDLKPENIMIGEFDEVFVMDWGLAGPFNTGSTEAIDARLTQEGTVFGTPKYMSPEQASGQTQLIGPTSDIYSLCAILYELVTLQHYLGMPPGGSQIVAVISAVLSLKPVKPEKIRSPYQNRVSRWLSITIMKGLEKNAQDRFQTVEELAEDIRLYAEGKRAPVCPHTSIQSMLRKMSCEIDNAPVLMTAMVVAVSLVFGLGLYTLGQVLLQVF